MTIPLATRADIERAWAWLIGIRRRCEAESDLVTVMRCEAVERALQDRWDQAREGS